MGGLFKRNRYLMKHFLSSLLAAAAAAAHLVLPILGFLNLLLLWAAAHAAQLHGLTLLCSALGAVASLAYAGVKLYLVWPRLLRRWGW